MTQLLHYTKPTSRPCRRVLAHLRDHGTSTVSAISEAVNVSVQAVAGAVRCVVEHGYVTTTGRRVAARSCGLPSAKSWAPALLTITPLGLVELEAALLNPPKVRDTWHERRGDREAVMWQHKHAIRRALKRLGGYAKRAELLKFDGITSTTLQHALPALVASGHLRRTTEADGIASYNLYHLNEEATWPTPATPTTSSSAPGSTESASSTWLSPVSGSTWNQLEA